MQKPLILIIVGMAYINCINKTNWVLIGSAITSERPCNGTNEIQVIYESDQPPEEENSYEVHISVIFPKYSIVTVMLDSDGSIKLSKKSFARIFASDNNSFRINFFKAHDGLSFTVKGNRIGTVPYIISLKINSQEYCSEPFLGFLDEIVNGYRDFAESNNRKLEGNCGRRKVTHTELIVNGASTKAGDWPWHAAIYRLDKSLIKYICGGTLISKHFVLTAAHCTSVRGVPLLPEVLSVVLGKFNLFGGDTGSQEREIHQIIVHNNFESRLLNNDIALLKLKTEAVFSDYIQPACLWYTKATERLSTEGILGTVVGWGFDNTDTLAHQLRKANMPLITEVVCIKSNPVFYSKVLNENKFCAGYHNGTSACNGDSGGAFQVFIPDNAQDRSQNAEGAWYVRGIVSLTLSRTDVPICDPTQYVVFTDVDKYRSWIENHAVFLLNYIKKSTLIDIMQNQLIVFLLLCLRYTSCVNKTQWTSIGSALLFSHPCKGSNEISVQYESDQSPENENSYKVTVDILFPKYSIVKIMLDVDGSIMLEEKSFARIFADENNVFTFRFFEAHDGLRFIIKGKKIGIVPYITSLNINSQEYCSQPSLGFLDTIVTGYRDYAESYNKKLEGNCGRRKVTHTELIFNGASTKAGDWPWHTAIYRLDKSLIKYICGGTLISKYFVLTAAHCTSVRGVPLLPEVLSVVLGKFNLIGGDTGSEEREVHQIILHGNYQKQLLDNDIALLKLKTEAVFSDYIQPACLWYSRATEKLSTGEIMGTVVGWGFDNTDTLAHQLRQANMPLITEVVCIKSNPVFYSKVLNENKFCAGYHNGTSACNGDSGGAFQVFIPDNAQDRSQNAEGAWYVRGIVSLTLSRTDVPICDPTQYVVFTDVDKYRSWIENHAGLI